MVIAFVGFIGRKTINICAQAGSLVLFLVRAFHTFFTTPLKLQKVFFQMFVIGVESFNIAVLTGTFAGMVFALQCFVGFKRVGGEQMLGVVVALAIIRELAPVLTGLMVTGRAGSAIAAEIGTMRITEQLDALTTLRINVFQYLVVPRMVAGTIIFPFLTAFAMFCGIIGGYVVSVYVLFLSPEDYINSIRTYVDMRDIVGGLIKAATFGFILTWVGTYKGYYTSGGARGVGSATTQSVVTSSVMILVANYLLTKLIEQL